MSDFAPHNLTADSDPPYTVSASSYYFTLPAYKAFDGSPAESSNSWAGSNGGVDWIKLDVGAGNEKTLPRYRIQATNAASWLFPDRNPKDWTMQCSTDDSSWDTVDTITGQTSWGDSEIREFVCDSPTETSYRYFKLNITANTGGDTYTQIGELYLFDDATSFVSAWAARSNNLIP